MSDSSNLQRHLRHRSRRPCFSKLYSFSAHPLQKKRKNGEIQPPEHLFISNSYDFLCSPFVFTVHMHWSIYRNTASHGNCTFNISKHTVCAPPKQNKCREAASSRNIHYEPFLQWPHLLHCPHLLHHGPCNINISKAYCSRSSQTRISVQCCVVQPGDASPSTLCKATSFGEKHSSRLFHFLVPQNCFVTCSNTHQLRSVMKLKQLHF